MYKIVLQDTLLKLDYSFSIDRFLLQVPPNKKQALFIFRGWINPVAVQGLTIFSPLP